MRHTIITLLALTITLAACTPATSLSPTATAAPTAISAPTATEAPTPTATIAPDDIADTLGLRSTPGYENRTFAIEQRDGATYLVDQYNKVPKAVKSEDDSWRELDLTNPADAEVMYGGLTPKGVDYLHDNTRDSSGFWSRRIGFRYAGDWRVEEVNLSSGEKVHLYEILTGLRDNEGNLRLAWLALDAPDYPPVHIAEITCSNDDVLSSNNGFESTHTWVEDMLNQLRVGEEVGMTIEEKNWVPKEKIYYFAGESYPEFNTAQALLMAELYNNFPEQFQLSTAERDALHQQNEWPARVVELVHQRGFTIRRLSEDDCPQYHAK